MNYKPFYASRPQSTAPTFPFESAEEAWFWFMQSYDARNDGARVIAGQALLPRPCEPLDILKCVDRLYRNRRLQRDHLLVLRHYGRRLMAPDVRRPKESRAHTLWEEAMMRLEVVLEKQGIVKLQSRFGFHDMPPAYIIDSIGAKQ